MPRRLQIPPLRSYRSSCPALACFLVVCVPFAQLRFVTVPDGNALGGQDLIFNELGYPKPPHGALAPSFGNFGSSSAQALRRHRASICTASASSASPPAPAESSAWRNGHDLAEFVGSALLSQDDLQVRQEVLSILRAIVQDACGPTAEVLPFGSTVIGHALRDSDIDVVVFVPNKELTSNKKMLQQISEAVEMTHNDHTLRVVEMMIMASVPIIVLEDVQRSISVDVCCQNLMGPLHSQLMRAYQTLFPGLSTIIAAVKTWAGNRRFRKAWRGAGLSSYTWSLMVVYYLQVQHGLPSLHGDGDRGYDEDIHYTLDFPRNVQLPGSLRSANLPEILYGFFEFYATDFDWRREVVCVRTGQRQRMSRVGRGFTPHPTELLVQDPVDPVVDMARCQRMDNVKAAIQQTHACLHKGESLQSQLGQQSQTQLGEKLQLNKRGWCIGRRFKFTNIKRKTASYPVLTPDGSSMEYLDYLQRQRRKRES